MNPGGGGGGGSFCVPRECGLYNASDLLLSDLFDV